MRLGEVCILTNDVIQLATFYKKILNIYNSDNNSVHQTLIEKETMLTIYNDGSEKRHQTQTMCISFTVDDINTEYERLLNLGVEIIEAPTVRPWGTTNMSFYDPDHNVVYIRSLPA